MTFDWSVVWHNAGALLEGIKLTVLLAVTTMVISIPGGIVLALMRLSNVRVVTRPITSCQWRPDSISRRLRPASSP
jgi:ABC-type amino acid transport system permease subunit